MIRPKGMEKDCSCSPWQRIKEQIQALYERVTQLGYKDTELENDISDIDDEIAQITDTLADKVDIEQGSLNEGLYLKVVEGRVTPSPVDIPEGGAVMASIIVGDFEGEELSVGVYERSGGRYQARFYKKIASMADVPRYIFKWVSGSIEATVSEGEWTEQLPMTLGYVTEATATNYHMPGAGWYIYVTRTYYEDPVQLGVSATALGGINLIYQEADQSTAATVGILSDSEIYQIINSQTQGFADTGLYNVNVGSWNAYKYVQVNDWGGLQYVDISIPEPTPAGAPDILTSLSDPDDFLPMGGTAWWADPADLISEGVITLVTTATETVDEADSNGFSVSTSMTKYATAQPPYLEGSIEQNASTSSATDTFTTYQFDSSFDAPAMISLPQLKDFATKYGSFKVTSISNIVLKFGQEYNQWTGYGLGYQELSIPDSDILSTNVYDGIIYVSIDHHPLYYLGSNYLHVRGSNWNALALFASADVTIKMEHAPEDMNANIIATVNKGVKGAPNMKVAQGGTTLFDGTEYYMQIYVPEGSVDDPNIQDPAVFDVVFLDPGHTQYTVTRVDRIGQSISGYVEYRAYLNAYPSVDPPTERPLLFYLTGPCLDTYTTPVTKLTTL